MARYFLRHNGVPAYQLIAVLKQVPAAIIFKTEMTVTDLVGAKVDESVQTLKRRFKLEMGRCGRTHETRARFHRKTDASGRNGEQ